MVDVMSKEIDKIRDIIVWSIHNGILAGDERVKDVVITKSVNAIKKVLLELIGDDAECNPYMLKNRDETGISKEDHGANELYTELRWKTKETG